MRAVPYQAPACEAPLAETNYRARRGPRLSSQASWGPLFALSLTMPDNFAAADILKRIEASTLAWASAPVAKRRRARRPTLAAAIKQASKAGVKVAGAVLDPSGKIELKFGEASADDSAASELDKWRSRRAGKSQGH
jgi:hypothetical protein